MPTPFPRAACAALLAIAITACSNPDGPASTAPVSASARPDLWHADGSRERGAWAVGAAVRWNAIAREETRSGALNLFTGTRMFAYLSLAQYNATVAATRAWRRGARPSVAAAVAGASAALLSAPGFLPDRAAFFEAELREAELRAAQPNVSGRGRNHADFAAGEAIGREVAAAVLASAATDGFAGANASVPVPVCPGCWTSAPSRLPLFPLLGQVRPFFLRSGDQFRPAPPPAFGSPDFVAALAEVRRISDTRTAEQDASAKFWAAPDGFASVIPAYNNQVAAAHIERYRLNELRAAHAFALMGMAAMDAFIACHDAKYSYWLLRPSQADPAITLSVPLPNFPAYPSNHACITGASMAVLADLFPSEATELTAQADEAALSRVYGGIHYRFDGDVGLALGRQVARYALQHDVRGHAAYPLR